MKRSLLAALALVAALTLAACGSSSGKTTSQGSTSSGGVTTSTNSAGCLKTKLKPMTIGVVNAASTGETINALSNAFTVATKILCWKADIATGAITPTRWGQNVTQFVQEKVGAIALVGFDPTAIGPQVAAARKAGIPVFATMVPLPAASAKLVNAAYSDNYYTMGQMAGRYAVSKTKAPISIAQLVKDTKGVQDFTNGIESVLRPAGGKIAASTDLDVTNQATSYTQNAQTMARQAPSAKYYFSGADNAPVYVEPALQSIGRSDMTIIVPFDDPTTIKQIQSGGNIAVVAANTERIAFEVVDVLAAHEAKGTAIPATYPDDNLKVKMVDKSDVGNGSPAFPIKDEVAEFTKKWASEYGGS